MTISSIDTATCNATDTRGCQRQQPLVEVGGWPTNLTIDNATGTLYVSRNVDATASIVDLHALR